MREFFVILNNQLGGGAYWNRFEDEEGYGGEHYEHNIHKVCEYCRYISYPDAMKMVKEIIESYDYPVYFKIERFSSN